MGQRGVQAGHRTPPPHSSESHSALPGHRPEHAAQSQPVRTRPCRRIRAEPGVDGDGRVLRRVSVHAAYARIPSTWPYRTLHNTASSRPRPRNRIPLIRSCSRQRRQHARPCCHTRDPEALRPPAFRHPPRRMIPLSRSSQLSTCSTAAPTRQTISTRSLPTESTRPFHLPCHRPQHAQTGVTAKQNHYKSMMQPVDNRSRFTGHPSHHAVWAMAPPPLANPCLDHPSRRITISTWTNQSSIAGSPRSPRISYCDTT
jgi:hypothetical protein